MICTRVQIQLIVFFLVWFEGFVQMLTHLLFFRGSLIIDQQVRQVDKLFIGTEQI